MMEIESYSYDGSEDSKSIYEMLKSWSPDDFPIPELLPKLGVIVKEEGVPLCFIAADMSNSIPRAIIDSLQTNPKVSILKRFKAVKLAENFLCRELKELGYSYIQGFSKKAGVACLSQKCGYEILPFALNIFHKSIA